MSELQSASHLTSRGREARIPSPRERNLADSPIRSRPNENHWVQLSPRYIAETMRHPFDALDACMGAASAAEQSFANRAAAASSTIQEWLDELSAWPWPEGGGSAGFRARSAKRRKLSRSEGAPLDTEDHHLASEVLRYQKRIDDISLETEDFGVEQMKARVLHDHIKSLSRSGSPMCDSDRSAASLATYAKMDDFTAFVTAIIVQALPNLSKLARLMDVWSVRLLVLQKTPALLRSLEDAEAALHSGWITIDRDVGDASDCVSAADAKENACSLSEEEFKVMRSVVEKKVLRAGRMLDVMLDYLEGRQDTLPEEWIDCIDAIEHDYARWITACEKMLRGSEWSALMQMTQMTPDSGETSKATAHGNGRPVSADDKEQTSLHIQRLRPQQVDQAPTINIESVKDGFESPSKFAGLDGSEDEHFLARDVSFEDSEDVGSGAVRRLFGPSARKQKDTFGNLRADEKDEAELELPLLPEPGRSSDECVDFTVEHALGGSEAFSSDPPDHGTPERVCSPDGSQEPEAVIGTSPTSTPSDFRASTGSVSFYEMPVVVEVPDDESLPRTPAMDLSGLEDSHDYLALHSSSKKSLVGEDDQLQQQISDILESLPAKIRLTSEPSAIDLNPPDFKMPSLVSSSRPLHTKRSIPRSQSNLSLRSTLSSRAGTPSFLLAPAPRARQQRNQDIKLYHLSRKGEAPIKLFIRCVGEKGDRVMVRVGGGWADLGEYLKEYASHHGRRSGGGGGEASRIDIKDLPAMPSRLRTGTASGSRSSPPGRPASALELSPSTPLRLHKTRESLGDADQGFTGPKPTPFGQTAAKSETSTSAETTLSRSSSRLSWAEEESPLGMAGPRPRNIEMSEESRAWVQSVKERVRLASGEQRKAGTDATTPDGRFGDLGKVGGTKRLFHRQR